MLVFALPATAQGIVLKPQDVFPSLATDLPEATLFMINGRQVYWQPAPPDEQIDGGAFNKLVLSLLALRLRDKDVIDFDADVATILPHIITPSGFQASIKVPHLLQETAGFASPPLSVGSETLKEAMSHTKLKRFAIRQRSPGQLSIHDPVGWAVLVAVIEASEAMPFSVLLRQQIAAPIGLSPADLQIVHHSLGGRQMPLTLKLSPKAIAAIGGLLLRNRTPDGAAFLDPNSYKQFVEGSKGFRFHPDGAIASYGITLKTEGRHSWIEPLNGDCIGTSYAAFPREGIVFGNAAIPGVCGQTTLLRNARFIANENFPGRLQQASDGPPLARPTKLDGRYTLAQRSPYGLTERLDILEGDFLNVFGYTGDQLRVRRNEEPVRFYRQTSAYRFENENDPTDTLLFSPFRLGGYVKAGDQIFRRADILGTAGELRNMLPWALLAILTAGYYAIAGKLRPWRRMGQFALIGGALVGGGLYLEANYWTYVLYEAGQPWVIAVWRLGLNIGLMLVLSLPMFVLSFAKKDMIPTRGFAILTAPHLILVALSSLMVFFALILWGVAGTVSPY